MAFGYIYILAPLDRKYDFHKIGFVTRKKFEGQTYPGRSGRMRLVKSRLARVAGSTNTPFEMYLWKVFGPMDDTSKWKQRIARHLQDYNVRGDWFTFPENVTDKIDNCLLATDLMKV